MPDVKEQVNNVGRALAERGLSFDHVDEFDNPMIAIGFGGGDFSYTQLVIHLVFDLDGESAQLVTSPIASVPVEKTAGVLLALNQINAKFRWVKFYLDDDNDIIADSDVLFVEQNSGDACVEMIMRTANTVDDAYADIMKAVWS